MGPEVQVFHKDKGGYLRVVPAEMDDVLDSNCIAFHKVVGGRLCRDQRRLS